MVFKILINYLCVCSFLMDFSNGQKDKKFFRKDYKYIGSTEAFYKIHTVPKIWSEAKKMCLREGANFFYPQNGEETHAILEFWNSTQSPIEGMFIGMSALLAKGVFETVDGKLAIDVYNNWYPGAPNDRDGDADCVILRQDGTLKDVKCFLKYPFICRKTLDTLEWNQKCNMPDLNYIINEKLGRCYKVHLTGLDWTEAYAMCRTEQSYLTVLNSEEESQHLAGLLKSAPLDKAKGEFCKDSIHLGIYNMANEGWQTFSGVALENTGFMKWAPQQPSGGDSEQCGSMFYNGLLHQISCQRRCLFICERELDVVPEPEVATTPKPEPESKRKVKKPKLRSRNRKDKSQKISVLPPS